jgi:hypothetical protein
MGGMGEEWESVDARRSGRQRVVATGAAVAAQALVGAAFPRRRGWRRTVTAAALEGATTFALLQWLLPAGRMTAAEIHDIREGHVAVTGREPTRREIGAALRARRLPG